MQVPQSKKCMFTIPSVCHRSDCNMLEQMCTLLRPASTSFCQRWRPSCPATIDKHCFWRLHRPCGVQICKIGDIANCTGCVVIWAECTCYVNGTTPSGCAHWSLSSGHAWAGPSQHRECKNQRYALQPAQALLRTLHMTQPAAGTAGQHTQPSSRRLSQLHSQSRTWTWRRPR